ncbi:MAG TPA: SgcJ/EcaC family oxidoreductase [Pyrinomonadaceae bacterium]|nr:SgcJ/EcaC family oxidoreductase [Pyrinomonadaceae bacterium]
MNAKETIQATIDQLVAAWNQNDIDAFISFFTDNASYISGRGLLLTGRQAILEGLFSNQPTGDEKGKVRITATRINLIKPDVAVVYNSWEMRSDDQGGEKLRSRKGIFTQVMISEGERWLIVALQNTDRD